MKSAFAAAALCVLVLWFYALATIIYFPVKIWIMKYRSRDVWSFLSRRRLSCLVAIYVVSAPLLIVAAGTYALLVGAASASGPGAGGGGGGRDVALLLLLGWIFLGVFLAAAVAAVVGLVVRPR